MEAVADGESGWTIGWRCPLRPEQIHAMSVESADLEAASKRYRLVLWARALREGAER